MPKMDRRRPNAALALGDGTVFVGFGGGCPGMHEGELVFNTSITGYQEILTDPSYAGQIVTFTFPHIGNVGTNDEDIEALTPHARGMVSRAAITAPSNWRSSGHLDNWLAAHGIAAIGGVDTRRITRILRQTGAQNAALAYQPDTEIDLDDLKARARPGQAWKAWTRRARSPAASATMGRDALGLGQRLWPRRGQGPHVVAIDYGVKRNILRSLANLGCRVTVVPASATAEEVLALAPDGVRAHQRPRRPGRHRRACRARDQEAGRQRQAGVRHLPRPPDARAWRSAARTEKMPFGHHGANHPVQDLTTGKVEITSQNHGFAVADDGLPDGVEVTHRSLFDGTIQGIRLKDRPVFSVQYHPEASPGPMDASYLFDRFLALIGHKAS